MKGLGKILYVDLSRQRVETGSFTLDLAEKYLAGRGINAHLLCSEMGVNVDPFSRDNLLVMSCGLLTGSHVPASARMHVTSKSPLTEGLGSSNVGGGFGARLKAAGIQTVIIKGRAPKPLWLSIEPGNAELHDASGLWGEDALDTAKILAEKLGPKNLDAAVIGPGGENLVRYAGIMVGHGHAAGRTGMGAVMGSKNLKAVTVKAALSRTRPEQPVKKAISDYHRAIMAAPRYGLFAHMSNTFVVGWANDLGVLSTRNFQKATFEGAERIDGRDMLRHVTKRKSCHRCPVHCRAEIRIKDGPYAGTGGERPDLEPIMTLGAKCGLDDSDAILYMHNLCNRLGIDTLSAGSSIAFAMEAYERGDLSREETEGLELRWGDKEVMEKLLRQIAARRGLGDVLADGVARAAERIGGGSQRYAYHSKGLELTGFDPRGLKATGLGYAISTRGGDFTSVYALAETKWSEDRCRAFFGTEKAANRFAIEGKGRMVRRSAVVSAVIDALGICKVPALSLLGKFDLKREAELVSLMTGWQVDGEILFRIGERIFNLENLFNLHNSPWKPKETLPEMFRKTPLDAGPSKGQTVDLGPMLREFYEAMGWDSTGKPMCSKLESLEIADFARKGECI